MKGIMNKAVKSMAEKQLKKEDEFFCGLFYQPKMPEGYERVIGRKKK